MANEHRYINPASISVPRGYTHVVEARGSHMIFVSGQIALDQQGDIVGVDDIGAQAEQVFKNLQAALAEVNATFDDVVKLTYFVVDISQMQIIRDVRNRYLSPDHLPASSAVEVRRLVLPELLLEVEAIAVLDD
jgi:enamine deaminase RidA (YjgF/YER057c/UK114 family)